ncbi:hypothetical protein Pcinc_023583 [Petrolisthes cinctipes]|uniref:Uncharacterized protein n=1 Tax=Petrolisthes cinctipes TaxID=88211 RepID=A0AAE1FC12_PETCI|nr:hypothetical protein Pcinc_023583 [Petrolisthes cinctipes]
MTKPTAGVDKDKNNKISGGIQYWFPLPPIDTMAPTQRSNKRSTYRSSVITLADGLRKVIQGGVSKSRKKCSGNEEVSIGRRLRKIASTAVTVAVDAGVRMVQDGMSLLHPALTMSESRERTPFMASLCVKFSRANGGRLSLGTSGTLSMSPILSVDENGNIRNQRNFEEERGRNLEAFRGPQSLPPERENHVDNKTHNRNVSNIDEDSQYNTRSTGATLDLPPRPAYERTPSPPLRPPTTFLHPNTPVSRQMSHLKNEDLFIDTPRPREIQRSRLMRKPSVMRIKREQGTDGTQGGQVVGYFEPAAGRTRRKSGNEGIEKQCHQLSRRIRNGGSTKESAVKIKDEPSVNIKEQEAGTREQIWPLVKREGRRF